jgi:ParB-like chromosome segregation protein Spo0J
VTEPRFIWLDIAKFDPNPWNPNAMDDEMFAKAIESIHEFGFVDPITVRERGGGRYQIIDGEHRWRAGREHSERCTTTVHVGYEELPAANLGVLPDEDAKQLTIVLNETRGEYEQKKMGALLVDLVTIRPLPELARVLPFTETRLRELAQLPAVDWNQLRQPTAQSGKGRAERWVERVYRMPADAAAKLDEALAAARADEPGIADWQGLQALADQFLGS